MFRYRYLATYGVVAGTIRRVLADVLGVQASGLDMTVDSDNNMMYFYTPAPLSPSQVLLLKTRGIDVTAEGAIERPVTAKHAVEQFVACAEAGLGCEAVGGLEIDATAPIKVQTNATYTSAASLGTANKTSSDDGDDGGKQTSRNT